MIKTLTNVLKQDKEKFAVPRKVQDIIPVRSIWSDGVFMTGKNKFSKMWRFTDINYAVASRDDKAGMFLGYSELLNSLDSGCTAKITINNRRLNMLDFEDRILLKMMDDKLDVYRQEYNDMLTDKATGSNAIIQDKYITISVNRKSIEDARLYFARIGADLTESNATTVATIIIITPEGKSEISTKPPMNVPRILPALFNAESLPTTAPLL